MIALIVLAVVSRCALPDLCPTDEQLVAAVRARDAAIVQAVADQAHQDDPNNVYLVHSERIRGISDVVCGAELSDEQAAHVVTINCKFTVRYWSTDAYHVAQLVKQNGEWTITDSLVVTRDRR